MSNILKYLEVAVTEICNLNCKACSHFSPLAEPEDQLTFAEFQADMKRIHEFFPIIDTIRLLGGEPLLHQDVFEMAKHTRELYPKSRITIVTNGLLIPGINDRNLFLMVENKIEFDISLYPPTSGRMDEIERKCLEYGVKHRYTDPIERFRVRFDPNGNNDGATSYRECSIGKTCTYLFKGRLSGCPAPNVIHLYNRRFGTEIFGDADMIKIHETELSADEIEQKLRSELSVCRYCAQLEEIPWSTCNGKPSAEDWIISRNKQC